MKKTDIGLIGLGVMGQNLALNLARKGWKVAVWSRPATGPQGNAVDHFVAGRARGTTVKGYETLTGLVESLQTPRILLLMLPADAVDEMKTALFPLLERGDVLIDGGNSHYADTGRRVREAASLGIHWVGCGISGGEAGALNGASLMPGGAEEAWPLIRPFLLDLAARDEEGTPCCRWMGPEGAGHYVKMVHNGIEYGDMQLIAEAYAQLKHLFALDNEQMAEVFDRWNQGRLHSYLTEIVARILRHKDRNGSGELLDHILDAAGQKGTGRWSAMHALQLNVPLDVVTEAVAARNLSAQKSLREEMARRYVHVSNRPVYQCGEGVDRLEAALYAARLTGYAQGFQLLGAASGHYGWQLDLSAVAQVWRAGCIIRTGFLGRVADAYRHTPRLPHLLLDEAFGREVARSLPAWKEQVSLSAKEGVATPVFSASLHYYLGLTTADSSARLIQAMRDYFGAHQFERTDSPRGTFYHESWT